MYDIKELYLELIEEMKGKHSHPVVNAILTFTSLQKGICQVGDLYKSFCQGDVTCTRAYFNRVLESKWVTFKDDSNDLYVDFDQPLEVNVWTLENSSENL